MTKLHCDKSTNQRIEKGNCFKNGQGIVQRLLAAREMGRNIGFKEIFKHELTSSPMALAVNGILATPSNKSALGEIIENSIEDKSYCIPFNSNDDNLCHIFDGMAIVHRIGKPVNTRTFDDYAKKFFKIIFKNKHQVKCIDF